MTNVLRGPADKSVFRNDPEKWTGYIDPLPACDIADATDDVFTSVSTIKQSFPAPQLVPWAAKMAAEKAWAMRHDIAARPNAAEADTINEIRTASDEYRDAAAGRGHTIHSILESLLDGGGLPMMGDDDPARLYLPSVQLLADDLAAQGFKLVASEVVVFSRGGGYAGTFDAVGEIGGERLGIDYKSRGPGKAASRQDREAAQMGGYFSADYWVVEVDGELQRMRPIPVDGCRVYSIAPEGYRYYDASLSSAVELWLSLLDFHTTSKRVTGTPALWTRAQGADVADSPSSATPDDPSTTGRSAGDRRVWLTGRLRAAITDHRETTLEQYALARVAHPDLPESLTPDFADEHLDILVAVVDQVEALHEEPFGDTDPAVTVEREAAATPTPQPEPRPRLARIDTHDEGVRYVEGSDGDPFPALKRTVEALPSSVSDRMLGWRHESSEHGIVWNCMGRRSERALEQMRAAMTLAKACEGNYADEFAENDHARAALAIVIGEETQLAIPVGAYIGNLSLDEARTLTKVATTLAEGGTAADALAVVA